MVGFSAKVRKCAIKERDAGDGREGGMGEDCDDMKKQNKWWCQCSKSTFVVIAIQKNERECNHRHRSIASQRTPRLLSLGYK